jgi:hypothetical protein
VPHEEKLSSLPKDVVVEHLSIRKLFSLLILEAYIQFSNENLRT